MSHAPALVGFLALLALAATLVIREPSPGALARSHADIGTTLETCATCHAEDGLDAGCLSCHDAIAKQIESGAGFHAERRSDCARCHPDHHGESFDVMEAVAWSADERASFDHGHVAFTLAESHEELSCERCHRAPRTYLGLVQQCASCHEDVHGGKLFKDCASCHDQKSFKPATNLDHDRFFPLVGQHREAACARCHSGLDYKEVKGKQCRSCHDSPHTFATADGCEECHEGTDRTWRLESFDHKRANLALSASHAAAACAQCHEPAAAYEQRFAARSMKECRSCHEDVHRGQFEAACSDCHSETRFKPARYDRERHESFALNGAHAKAKCNDCHTEVDGTRRFVDTPRSCAACHEDPHDGQLAGSCAACHTEEAFLPARYPLERHKQFPLEGAHGAVACNSCHTKQGETRRFVGTPKECAACHENPHGDQFAPKGCATCHTTARFRIQPYEHTGYRLEGEHGKADCARCHRRAGKPPVRVYRGTSRDCASCHRDEHRGQFAPRSCDACHAGFREWELRKFDHSTTRFPLDGRHRRISCDDCHPKVKQRDGREVVQYRPLGHQCKDCHEVERR
ncbi:MAG: hypothetical protein ACYTEG_05345 [Planctomycetota bacterium]